MEFHLVRFQPGNPLALKDSLLSGHHIGSLTEGPPCLHWASVNEFESNLGMISATVTDWKCFPPSKIEFHI